MQVSSIHMMSQEITTLTQKQIRVISGAVHHRVQAMTLLVTDPDKTRVAVLVSLVHIKHNMTL